MNERELFIEALQKTAGAERDDFLKAACGDDSILQKSVEELLAEHQKDASFFIDAPPPGLAAATEITAVTEQPGDTIGPYKLLQQIGEGGMGVVYMAEQTHPVVRRVALKIIKPGMDTRQVIARFEAERQALAMMDHPNIAKVLDAGTTDSGRPYFVMELVKGMPVTQYCDEQHLSPRERLELFVPICQAVQHAHQKGIIHRDLKPSNILIAQYDDKPVPKIIDFGVAKAISHNLTEKTMFTQYGQIVGTIEYMSPEQARFNQLDVDTRSDIYSLGVLLYELLTGETPFDKTRLRAAAFDELLRIIRDEEPPRMSIRLSSSETLANTAINRKTEPKKLSLLVRGELDWIVMKALEKDRNRRYETATGFAADVQRYLNDEQVLACPPSARYRLRKFVRRNRTFLIAVTLISFALIAGIVGTTWQANRAEAQAERTRTETAKSQAIADLLQRMLGSATPDQAKGSTYTVRQMLHDFSASLGDQLADQPEVAAAIHSIMAKAYWRMDEGKALVHAEAGLKLHRQLYGADHPKVADSLIDCAWALYDGRERLEQSVPLIQEAIAIYRRHGQDHSLMKAYRVLVRAHVNLTQFADAERVYREALETYPRVEGVADAEMACILHEMAHAKCKENDLGGAESLGRRAVELHQRGHGVDGLETGYGWGILGDALLMQGKYPEAESCFRKSMSILHKHYSPNSAHISAFRAQLIHALRHQNKFDEAIVVFREALEQRPGSVELHVSLGTFLCEGVKSYDEAAECFLKAIELRPDHAEAHKGLGDTRAAQGNLDEAIAWYLKAIELSPQWNWPHCSLGDVLATQGKPDEAIVHYRKAIELDPEWSWPRPRLANVLNRQAWAIANDADHRMRDPDKAVLLAEEAVELAPTEADYWNTLGAAQYRAGDWQEAITALEKSRELRTADGEWSTPLFLAMAHWQLGHRDEARQCYNQGLASIEKYQQPEDLLRLCAEAAEVLGIENKE